jgi:hypothetical protein
VTRRRILAVLALAVLLALTILTVASAYEGSSMYDNVSPQSQTPQGLSDRYPDGNYGLDYHVEHVGLSTPHTHALDKKSPFDILPNPGSALVKGIVNNTPTGLDLSDAPDLMAHKLAAWGWDIERFISNIVITVFTFALSLDLLTGQNGALRPAADAVDRLYSTLGGQWFGLFIGFLGLWIAVQMLGRNVTHTVGQVAKSLGCVMLAMLVMAQSTWVVGGGSHLFHDIGTGIMGQIVGKGDAPDAKTAAADALHRTLIDDPFTVLEFGGTAHCVDADKKPVKPFSADCKTRINNEKADAHGRGGYVPHWLKAGPPNGPGRTLWYQAMLDGKKPSAKQIDDAGLPANAFDGVTLSAADTPAVDMQQAPSGGERLAAAFVLFWTLMPIWLLVGGLALGAIVAGAIALAWFIGTPIALLFALVPGPGVEAFMLWGKSLLLALTRQLWYGLILAIGIAVSGALTGAVASVGWLLAFLAQAGFWGFLLVKRKHLYMGLSGALSRRGGSMGGGQQRSTMQRMQQAYYQQMAARQMGAPFLRAGRRLAVGKRDRDELGGAAGLAVRGSHNLAEGAHTYARHLAGQDDPMNAGGQKNRDLSPDDASRGHAANFVASAALPARAITELEGEHAERKQRVAAERQRRANIKTLQDRDHASRTEEAQARARVGIIHPGEEPLTEKEQATLAGLTAGRMDNVELARLRGQVGEVDDHRRQTGQQFPDARVDQRAAEIAARDRAEREHATQDGTSPGRASLRDRLRRAGSTSSSPPPAAPTPSDPTFFDGSGSNGSSPKAKP